MKLNPEEMDRMNIPIQKSKLYLTPDFIFISIYKKPKWWFRKWQYLLLNWKWEDIK